MQSLKAIIIMAGLLSFTVSSQELVPPPQDYQLFVDTNQLIRSLDSTELSVEESVTLEAWIRFLPIMRGVV